MISVLTDVGWVLAVLFAFVGGMLCGVIGTAIGFSFARQHFMALAALPVPSQPTTATTNRPTPATIHVYNGDVCMGHDTLPPTDEELDNEAWKNN